MICLYVQAPFAAFRTFTAGSFRPTAGFVTPSAAYGFLLNLAGIESRLDDGKSVMTLTKPDLPGARIALGALSFPVVQSLYQQVHNYPIGADAVKQYIAGAKGNKYNITPTRRSFLSNLSAYICMNGNDELEKQVRYGLAGGFNASRYGIPFMGDNNFMIDRLYEEADRRPAYWYEKIMEQDERSIRKGATRLTISINRQVMAKTRSALLLPPWSLAIRSRMQHG